MDSVTPDDVDPHTEIAQLEDRIEQLARKLEGCRKVALAAPIALASGGVILLGLMFGLIRFDPLAMTAAIVALLGGTVLAGSNRSTALETEAELAESERRRAALIGTIPLRVVEERPMPH